MNPKPPTCEGCPALTSGQGFVPGSGPLDAKVAFVGQGPGEAEAYDGRPFVGPSGSRLEKWMVRADPERRHLVREKIYVDNVVRCWLPKNRPPTRPEVEHCTRVHVMPVLMGMDRLQLVVPVGTHAARRFLGKGYSESAAGALTRIDLDLLST